MNFSSLTVWRLILISALSLFTVSPTWINGWSYNGAELSRVPVSFIQSEPNIPMVSANINGTDYCVELMDAQAVIVNCQYEEEGVSWSSPARWDVKQAFFSDLNRDGNPEAVLLVWRPFQPWPVDRFMPHGGRIDTFADSQGNGCQVILIGWKDGKFREVWAGSAMADPLHEIRAVDLDGDGMQELAGLEYPYNGRADHSSLVVWEWNGFGFSLEDREKGSYSTLQVVQDDQLVILMVR